MKKFLTLFMVLLSAVCLCFGLAACDSSNDEEQGDVPPPADDVVYDTWTPSGDHKSHYLIRSSDGVRVEEDCAYIDVVVAPTCEKAGYTAHACPACGDVIEQDETPALGHSYSEWQSDGKGKHFKVCANDATHRIEETCDTVASVVAPKCEEGGYTVHTCDDCGYTYTDTPTQKLGHALSQNWVWDPQSERMHKKTCTREGCNYVESVACSFESEVVKPTCEHDGYTEYTCEDCGNSYRSAPVPALGHKWIEGVYTPSEGNKDGNATHYLVCEHDETHTKVEACSFAQAVTEATCKAGGYTTFTCSLCKFSYTGDETKQLDHAWGSWTHDEGKESHSHTCTNDGCNVTESLPCNFAEETAPATCVNDGLKTKTCRDCQNVITETLTKLGHDYGDPVPVEGKQGEKHLYTCERDGCTAGTDGHTKEEACEFTDVKDQPACLGGTGKVCLKCRYSASGPIEPHKWKDVTPDNAEGWKHIVEGGVDKHTRTCSVCNTTETKECSLTEKVKDATCTEAGGRTSSCAHCKYTTEPEEIEALGHDFTYQEIAGSNGKKHTATCSRESCEYHGGKEEDCTTNDVVTPPTCAAEGYTTHTCTLCHGSYKGETTSKIEHVWILKTASEDNRQHEVVCSYCSATEMQDCAYTGVVHDATCTANGYTTYTCDFCSHCYNGNETDKLEHNWGTARYDAAAHTHARSCTVCGEEKSFACSFDDGQVVEPTCSAAGYTIFTCSVCQGTYNGNPVDKKDHTFGPWTHVKAGFTAMNSEHEHTCTVCGTTEREQCHLEFKVIDPTCTTQGYTQVTCRDCNRETTRRNLVAAYGHTYEDHWKYSGDDETNHTHTKQCIRCDKTIVEPCQMVRSSTLPTCEAPGIETEMCSGCGHTEDREAAEKLFHDLSDYISGNNGTHYRYCLRENCSYKEENQCTYDSHVTPESCTEPSKTEKKCPNCQHVIVEYGPTPQGHRFELHEIKEGTHELKCSVCSFEESKEHDFTNSNICICGYDGLSYEQPDLPDAQGKAAYYVVKGPGKATAAKNIVIPALYNDLPVQYVSKYAFNRNTSVETVVLPHTLIEVGESAFASCVNLRSVTFEKTDEPCAIKIFRLGAFQICPMLTEMEFPDGLAEIDYCAFSSCSSLMDIDLPDSVTEIGRDAFNKTARFVNRNSWTDGALYLGKHLIKVHNVPDGGEFRIEEGTVSVGNDCFDGLTGLVSLWIPSSLIAIDADAFEGCTGLTNVEFAGNVRQWLGILFENDLASPMHYATTLKIDGAEPNKPNGVLDLSELEGMEELRSFNSIPAGTFRGIQGIKKVIIPAEVKTIGSNAFNGCTDLEAVELKGDVTKLGDNVFDNTKFYNTAENWEEGVLYLTGANGHYYLLDAKAGEVNGAVTVKNGTLIICATAFMDCRYLTAVTIPDTVIFIGAKAFKGCVELSSVTFEGEVTFLAFNESGAGRWYSTTGKSPDLLYAASNAEKLKGYLSGEWTKTS